MELIKKNWKSIGVVGSLGLIAYLSSKSQTSSHTNNQITQKGGLYYFKVTLDDDTHVIKVGRTDDFNRRYSEHCSDKQFTKCEKIYKIEYANNDTDSKLLVQHETDIHNRLKKYQYKYPKVDGGNYEELYKCNMKIIEDCVKEVTTKCGTCDE